MALWQWLNPQTDRRNSWETQYAAWKAGYGSDMAQQAPNLKATDLSSLLSCDRKVYLEYNGDQRLRAPMGAFDAWLAEQGRIFEARVTSQYPVVTPRYPHGDIMAGYNATIQLMRQGTPYIYQGVLANEDVVGIPDLMERVEGGSRLGGFFYRPIDIKYATSATAGHRLQLMAYLWMLEAVQGVRPDGSLFLRLSPDDEARLGSFYQEEKVVFDVPEFQARLAEARELARGFAPLPFISTVCKSCAWQAPCKTVALEGQDVSLIPGVRRSVWAELHQRRLGTLPAAAATSREQLINIRGVGEKTADSIILHARAMVSKLPVQIGNPDLPPVSQVEVFFDIESVPNEGLYYLFGLLTKQRNRWVYEYELAQQPTDERAIWESFLRRIDRLGGWVYHFGSYEQSAIKKLQERYGADLRADSLLKRMVDLEKSVKQTVVMPLESYSLKDVAGWLNFQWAHGGIDRADDSILEYVRWLESHKKSHLDRIVQYNEDDCRATVLVRDWLLSQPRI